VVETKEHGKGKNVAFPFSLSAFIEPNLKELAFGLIQ